jgi:hypothetical protein
MYALWDLCNKTARRGLRFKASFLYTDDVGKDISICAASLTAKVSQPVQQR